MSAGTSRAAAAAITTITRVAPDSYQCASNSFIDFEEFPDKTDLSARTFPGVQFTTTDGTDWVVGDFSTGLYNGKYPSGAYTSRGTHWAWLGISQGRGRIDLARPARVFSLLVSAATNVSLEAYASDGSLIATAGPTTFSTSTGQMDELRIDAGTARITHLVVHDSSNFFLVDAVCTDALGANIRNDPRNVPSPFSVDSDYWQWPDADKDGLPDYWEQHGVWVSGKFLDLPALGANQEHKDAFLWIDAVNSDYVDNGVRELIRKAFDASPLTNPDNKNGVSVHYHVGDLGLDKATYGVASSSSTAEVANVLTRSARKSGYIGNPMAGDQSVPPVFKYVLFGETIPNATGKALHIPGSEAMIAVSDSYLDSIGNLVWKTGRFWPGESRAFVRAVIATHEIGHLLGLRHHGNRDQPTSDSNYKSVMSYSYSTFGLPPSGFFGTANVIDYSRSGSTDPASSPPAVNLDWRVGTGQGAIKFVAGQFGEGAANYYFQWQPEEFRQSDDDPEEPESLPAQVQLADPASLASFVAAFAPPLQLAAGKTTCDGSYEGIGKDVIVPAGAVCSLLPGAIVTHDVTVQEGGTLNTGQVTVGHDVRLRGAAGAVICQSTVMHDLSAVNGSAGAAELVIGDTSTGCDAGNDIGHDLVVESNSGPVSVGDNIAGHDVRVRGNSFGGTRVNSNFAAHDAICFGNEPQFGSGNQAGHANTCPA